MSRRPMAYIVERRGELVAVGGEALLYLRARVCDECERDRLSETATVSAQKLVDLPTLVGDSLVWAVNGIDNEDDVDGVLASVDGLEGRDVLRGFVVKKSEVLLLEIGDRWPRFRRNHNVEVDSGRRGGR